MGLLFMERMRDESRFKELKEEVKKTEYEKAREPLQNEIRKLNEKIWELEKQIKAYRQVFEDIVSSLDLDYIRLYIRENPIEVQFGKISDIKLTQANLSPITVPIKELLRSEIYRKIAEIYNDLESQM